MIRQANAVDIPAIVALLQQAHAESKYASVGQIDCVYAKQLLHRMIMSHGGRSGSGTHCMVAEKSGAIVGLHFGMKDRVHQIGTLYCATDLFFYVSKDASPFYGPALLDDFLQWTDADPRIVEVTLASNDTTGEQAMAAGLYERRGFKRVGALYERATLRKEEVAA